MEPPLIYVFDDFATAERAHAELLNCGFHRDAVDLTVRYDEAGPVQGNFVAGDEAAAAGGHGYDDKFANTTHRGGCLLTITPADPTQAKYALALMARYNVMDSAAPGAPQGGDARQNPSG